MKRFAKKSWKAGALAIAIVLIPTVAFAAVGAFTSATVTPAVTATNSSTANLAAAVSAKATGTGANTHYGVLATAAGTNSIGVSGAGTKWGVISNGPLGVLAGKNLVCTLCVTTADLNNASVTTGKIANGAVTPAQLSAAAKTDALGTGETESGVYAVGDSGATMYTTVTYDRPLASPASSVDDTAITGTNTNCPGAGQALPGFLCLYPTSETNIAGFAVGVNAAEGYVLSWTVSGAGAHSYGTYTVGA